MKKIVFLVLLIGGIAGHSVAQVDSHTIRKIDHEVKALMEKGDIPGVSLTIISNNQRIIRNYGYANVAERRPVTSNTLFEIGSCTKAFTALAVMQLVSAGAIGLDKYARDYLPWFKATYKNKPVQITIRQLLHHTSGIPWHTISSIPATDAPDALEQTVRKISDVQLKNLPGRKYEYATVNYDILALVIEQVTHQPFENYLQEHVLNTLQLTHTTIGKPFDGRLMATGYKISFFKARPYQSPVYRGNYAAGYVISDAIDMARWVELQMGTVSTAAAGLIKATHQRDETVPLHGMLSYAMGWDISLSGNGEISHGGLNPGYTSYVAFRPLQKVGIVVLANSNSTYTPVIGDGVIKLLTGEEKEKPFDPGDRNDRAFSTVSFIAGAYIMVCLAILGIIVTHIIQAKRKYEGFSFRKLGRWLVSLLLAGPFLFGLYLLPDALANFTWQSILVWTPASFAVMVALILVAVGISYILFLLNILFPEKNALRKMLPATLLMSVLSGVSNMLIIVLVTSSVDDNTRLGYLIYFYVLALGIYLFGRRLVQVNLIRFTTGAIYELRIKMIGKIFSTTYQQFEKIEQGRIYTALNDDIDTIGTSTSMFVSLTTSVITAIGAFLYLSSLAFWATLLTLSLVIALAFTYSVVSKSTRIYFEEARDSRNVFIDLLNGMIRGFKEISLHRNKKLEYKEDVRASADKWRERSSKADIRFVNTFLIGESLLIILLGMVAFAMPKLFPGIAWYTLLSFIILLLYLIGPINGILNSVPSIMRLRIAWKRIQQFMNDIPAGAGLHQITLPARQQVESIRAEGVTFQYKRQDEQHIFKVGPIDLEVRKGEILFIIGGNGSGKTTLVKLLTGLYEPDEGKILIDDKVMDTARLSEYFSAVFSPPYLFEKLYNIDVGKKSEEIQKYLRLLNLDKKVTISKNGYSTIELSGGQRKRLALLQCYLEDAPIYLFDEWAADQDPEYRNFFYKTLLPEMKKQNKIVIAITHDDHYFGIADKLIKMNQGKPEVYTGEYSLPAFPA